MFPTGMVGIALFALRIAVATRLVLQGISSRAVIASHLADVGLILLALALSVGFLTPHFALLSALLELVMMIAPGTSHNSCLLLSDAETFILVVLGPGGYSVDAKLFGRQKLRIPPRKPHISEED